MYHVYVNGFLRTTVKATEKTKALVEGVDSSKVIINLSWTSREEEILDTHTVNNGSLGGAQLHLLTVLYHFTKQSPALFFGPLNSTVPFQPHRISVRSVLVNRKTSKDAACTMIIGRDAPLGPSCVKAGGVTSSSALITWLPSNSNFQHTVCINNVEVRTVRAGVFKHLITGMSVL